MGKGKGLLVHHASTEIKHMEQNMKDPFPTSVTTNTVNMT